MAQHENFMSKELAGGVVTNSNNLHSSLFIGVFWDIENIQVPRGKSAIALVKNIRERFFENHREAEFMCVCDVNNQNRKVIDELALAQVDVVHINATSKNAADCKIKQCMKRFVDTYGAASTLLLISEDVNFSSDLSDFRYRHKARIILIHRGRAHKSLLVCAHEHYYFSTIASDLPDRNLDFSTTATEFPDRKLGFSTIVSDVPDRNLKFSTIASDLPGRNLKCSITSHLPNRNLEFSTTASNLPGRKLAKSSYTSLNVLLVTDLPTIERPGLVTHVLRKLSQNCSGNVFEVSGNKAVICFPTEDAAITAQKQMNKKYVYGKQISVSLYCRNNSQLVPSPVKRKLIQTASTSSNNKKISFSPLRDKGIYKNPTNEFSPRKFLFPQLVAYNDNGYPTLSKNYFSKRNCKSLCNKNRDCIPTKKMPIYSEKGSFKKGFSHHPAKFGMKLPSKFEKDPCGSMQDHYSSANLDQNMKLSISSDSAVPWSSEHKNHLTGTNNHRCNLVFVHVQKTKSSLTSERKLGRQNRIAAQFTIPIGD